MDLRADGEEEAAEVGLGEDFSLLVVPFLQERALALDRQIVIRDGPLHAQEGLSEAERQGTR